MYKRMYGLPRTHSRQKTILCAKSRKSERKERALVTANDKSSKPAKHEPFVYSFRPRRTPRPSERDYSMWRRVLDHDGLAKLKAIEEEREKEKAERRKEKEREKREKEREKREKEREKREKEKAEKEKEKSEKEIEKEAKDEKENEKLKEEGEEKVEEEKMKTEVEKDDVSDTETVDTENNRLDEERLRELKQDCLVVEDIELHVQENADDHHTDLFECTDRVLHSQLVVRRGQEFKLTLTFQRPWDSKQDDMHLIFKIGEENNTNKGTFVRIKLEEGDNTDYMTKTRKKWGARILKQSDNTLTLAVYAPPDAIIGEWEYSVRTVRVKDGETEEFDCEPEDEVIILLNPWCKDDQVYMENTDDLKEYITNQIGLVFCGSSSSIQSRPWNYGQHEEGILEACLHILRKANDFEISANMGDPIYITRALSRILNNLDDNGVLVGRWDGDYGEGKSPTFWQGSAPILEQYMKDGQPVKFGQCWVFSHLLTTVARALGLPCRSVTNFGSAHDTDLTMTIDKYVDEDGEDVEYKNNDSVWNFHVWNEVWIHRPDLDKLTGHTGKYDGWHAVDATPQELSDSVYQCGPSPVAAIKEGDVHIGYDTKFIFAEVNADYCHWQDGMPPTLISGNSGRVGKKISTKHPNGTTVGYYFGRDAGVRLDLTDQYKYAEGSVAEREVVEKATKKGKLGEHLFANRCGVEISIEEPEKLPRVGQEVTVKIQVKNASSEKQQVRLRASIRPTNYWGAMIGKKKVASKLFDEETLSPGQTEIYELKADPDDIIGLCDDSLSMKVMAICEVHGHKQRVFESDELVIKTPGIKCMGPASKVNKEEEIEVEFVLKNPLPKKALTSCELHIEGSVTVEGQGFERKHGSYVKGVDDLTPGEVRNVTVKVKASPHPRRSSERELNVGLSSKELPDFVGNLHIELN